MAYAGQGDSVYNKHDKMILKQGNNNFRSFRLLYVSIVILITVYNPYRI